MRWSLLSALIFAVAGFTCTAEGKEASCDAPTCTAAPTCGVEAACNAQPACADPSGCSSGCSNCGDSGCGQGGCGKCGCFLSRGYEGLDRHFNCGCNGSYKFPVPPLYTYHWSGMYSQQLMTDYHSPWRFPPIKPYSDERLLPYPSGEGVQEALPPAPPAMSQAMPPSSEKNVQVADYSTATKVVPGNAESVSNKLKRVSRYFP